MHLSFEEVKAKYFDLCSIASQQKGKISYYHAVGVAQGYMRGIIDFVGAAEAGRIMDAAESLNKTTMGIPEFQKSHAHA